jgi:hypothetical protein
MMDLHIKAFHFALPKLALNPNLNRKYSLATGSDIACPYAGIIRFLNLRSMEAESKDGNKIEKIEEGAAKAPAVASEPADAKPDKSPNKSKPKEPRKKKKKEAKKDTGSPMEDVKEIKKEECKKEPAVVVVDPKV